MLGTEKETDNNLKSAESLFQNWNIIEYCEVDKSCFGGYRHTYFWIITEEGNHPSLGNQPLNQIALFDSQESVQVYSQESVQVYSRQTSFKTKGGTF